MINVSQSASKTYLMEGRLHPSGLLSAVTVLLENLILKSPNENFFVNLGPGSLYYDRKFGENAWEYYFTQPDSNLILDKHLSGARSLETGFLFKWKGLLDPSNRMASYESTLLRASDLFGKAFGFNEETSFLLEKARQDILPQSKILAVHRRDTDYYPNIPQIETFFKHVYPFVENGSQIYLATDSKEALSKFKNRYGRRVIFQKATRSGSRNPVHTSRRLFKSPALIGREVLVDAYLMSKCEHLVRTRSNVTTFTRILNPGIPCSEIYV